MNKKHRLTRMLPKPFKWLSAPHPLLYLLIYLIAIPLFAVRYHAVENEFYQSTSQFDTTFLKHREQVQKELTALWRRWLSRYNSPTYRIELDSIDVYKVQMKADDIVFSLAWQASVQDETGRQLSEPNVELANTEWILQLPPRELDKGEYPNGTEFTASQFSDRLAAILPKSDTTLWADWGEGFYGMIDNASNGKYSGHKTQLSGEVWLSEELHASLIRFRQSNDGLTIATEGSYWRFLYFSAITITTVGFGDIVPLTDSARLWVASEAVIGVILVGLFLNSLGARIAQAATTRAP